MTSKNGLGMQKGHVLILILSFPFVRQSQQVYCVHDRFPISVPKVIQFAVNVCCGFWFCFCWCCHFVILHLHLTWHVAHAALSLLSCKWD